jgi:glycosyltransferase involved in cell wall biosynthesis
VNWPEICAAVIPCFNEERTIRGVVSSVRQHLPTVLVVDDGCTDATPQQATLAGATVLRHAKNHGKGEALRTGWKEAGQRGFTWALCMDGDGQHAAEDIPGFFRRAEETPASLIIGDRMQSAEAMPCLRRVVNGWMSRRLSVAAGRTLPDSQCGFRLMNLEDWSQLPIKTTRFEIESEVLLSFVNAGYKVEFVPIHTIYKGEPSKIHPWRDTVRWFKWWWHR